MKKPSPKLEAPKLEVAIPSRRQSPIRDRFFRFVCPPDVRERMSKHDVNWSEYLRRSIEAALAQLEADNTGSPFAAPPQRRPKKRAG